MIIFRGSKDGLFKTLADGPHGADALEWANRLRFIHNWRVGSYNNRIALTRLLHALQFSLPLAITTTRVWSLADYLPAIKVFL